MAEFKPGDLVRHRTGGPVWCVVPSTDDDQNVELAWVTRWNGGGYDERELWIASLVHHEPTDGDGIDVGDVDTVEQGAMLDDAGDKPEQECKVCGMTRAEHVGGACPGGVGRWRP